MLLYPFKNQAFIICIRIDYFIQIEVLIKYILNKKLFCFFKPFVEKYRADKSLKSIAVKILCNMGCAYLTDQDFIDPHRYSQLVQDVMVYYPGTELCKKSFIGIGKSFEKIIRKNRIQNGISEIFKSFVVNFFTVREGKGCRTVNESYFV